MRNTTPPKDFQIHVDPSCLSDESTTHENTIEQSAKEEPTKTQGDMSPERVSSNQTVVHHDSWAELEIKGDSHASVVDSEVGTEQEHEEDIPSPHVESLRATVEDVSDEEEDLHPQSAKEKRDERERVARERQIDRIEAQIQAAARAVVASIEEDDYRGGQDSELSMQTDTSYDREGTKMTHDGTDLTYEMGTELTYGDETEATYESDHESNMKHEDEADPTYGSQNHSDREGGDTSSHHDGDIDDDVFSHSDCSKRSSMNSDVHNSDDNQKLLTSPVVGEEAGSANKMETISRTPSSSSYMQAPADMSSRTPSKVLDRPPFRTPSSVRAMQMSSPTQSVFASPRSVKRHPTVSRIGTPNSQYSPSKRTPTRFKAKKEPLVLLHVTVLPLQWPYSHLMPSSDIPESLQMVKESWRLLQGKVGDTVLERGVLLPHPQDSYEVLEERLLEALELPVRPRAKILRCGHYMGPSDSEVPSSDEEGDDNWDEATGEQRKWCDICRRDVRLETVGDVGKGERRFRVKIYASNGLMRAGAWAAAWREMERVDVEIEPFVEMHLTAELEDLALTHPQEEMLDQHRELDDGFEDEELIIEHVHDREAEKRHEEEMRLHEEEQMQKQLALEEELRQRMVEEEEMMQRKALEEQRMQEIYGTPEPIDPRRSSSRTSVHDDSSFSELLLAAFKVAVRDSKNVVIGVLSVLVLLLALRPKSVSDAGRAEVIVEKSPVQVTTTVFQEPKARISEPVSTIEQVVQMISESAKKESIVPVTTTVYRELTVTERVPAPTLANVADGSSGGRGSRDPCETPVKSQEVDAAPKVDEVGSAPETEHSETIINVAEPAIRKETQKEEILPVLEEESVQMEEVQIPFALPSERRSALSSDSTGSNASDDSASESLDLETTMEPGITA
ncbi:uncharacterized protein RAG0_05083 [Rhynchosporium agropyri]|uniref:Pathway-specific nitrogen regulator n=1 Tax=Rhynchosporium agropyri TaxID=914238 RepID=A0A1E1KBL8_9HELO|nr:uncharacterized protein RAG0_05083 [Rhynchosporium agropyri]